LIDSTTAVCRALSHPARRMLLQALLRGECDVGGLSAGSGLDQPTASKHLATLRGAGLVQVRIDGRRRCYSVTQEATVKSLLDLLAELETWEAAQSSGGAASGD
jgi:DNA-binding transcriptional ArsR family regulator